MTATLFQASKDGNVELVTFLGPITWLDVAVAGDEVPVLVDLPSAEAADLAFGQPVTVSVPPDAIRLFR